MLYRRLVNSANNVKLCFIISKKRARRALESILVPQAMSTSVTKVAPLANIPPQICIFGGCSCFAATSTGWPVFWYVIFQSYSRWTNDSFVKITFNISRSPLAIWSMHHLTYSLLFVHLANHRQYLVYFKFFRALFTVATDTCKPGNSLYKHSHVPCSWLEVSCLLPMLHLFINELKVLHTSAAH